jgi:hypothetical protein
MAEQLPIKSNHEAAVELLGQYVDAAASSASRARAILIVMITAGVLTFVAYWNTRPDAWLTGRINKANAALRLFDPNTKGRLSENAAKQKFAETEEELHQSAKKFIEDRNITDRDLLVDFIERLRGLQLEQVTTLHVPFFGVTFDVNDLGIFAGLTFSVILLWFRFSLVRELINLRETFIEAKELGDEYRHHCYNLLAMRQVLTIPPMPNEVREPSNVLGRGFWRIFPEVLFFLPFIVYTRLFFHDLQTIDLAATISQLGAAALIVLSFGFLIIILVFTLVCWRLSREISREWRKESALLAREDKKWNVKANDADVNVTRDTGLIDNTTQPPPKTSV